MDEQEAKAIAREWLKNLNKESGNLWTFYNQGDCVIVINEFRRVLSINKDTKQVVGMEVV